MPAGAPPRDNESSCDDAVDTLMNERHAGAEAPSAWVARWAHRIPAGGAVLDVACGGGRHARLLAALGHSVLAVDRDREALTRLAGVPGVTTLCADLEQGPWPCAGRAFAGIVVTNYLHRPLFPLLLQALAVPGVLIYETFATGNEHYGRPCNPDYLLQPGELLDRVKDQLTVVAYEHLVVSTPRPAFVQRICAARDTG